MMGSEAAREIKTTLGVGWVLWESRGLEGIWKGLEDWVWIIFPGVRASVCALESGQRTKSSI